MHELTEQILGDTVSHLKPPVEDFTDANIKVGPPKTWAVGLPAIKAAMLPALGDMGPVRTAETSLTINHERGFDCPSCAWTDPVKGRPIEFCENGFKAVVWASSPLAIQDDFWATHSLSSMKDRSEYWLGNQGRITKPVYKAADSDHYEVISWDDAFDKIADKLADLDDPNEAVFYTAGHIMNEPAFLTQLLARAYGTNNLPDCSNMCHEATGSGMSPAIGVGKSTVFADDFGKADLIIMMGHNPGTNHPRMLNSLEQCKRNGGQIAAVNPLPEASLFRYKNPQQVSGLVGDGTKLADQFVHIRIGGDQYLLQALAKHVLLAEEENPGKVLDWDFINTYCAGFEEYRKEILALDDDEVARATGLSHDEIAELGDRYIASNGTIITWALGVTQHKNSVATIGDIMNLLFLRGNIGKPGAGASPLRGHSNVQGDRTMGIWERMPQPFLDKLGARFDFTPPSDFGYDSVDSMNAISDGKVKFFMSMSGNLVSAMSDTRKAESGIPTVDMTVQVSTKLNRSHIVTGKEALILPVLARTEKDIQASGLQSVTAEDTVCRINESHGDLDPIAPTLLSDVAVLCQLGQALEKRGKTSDAKIPWQDFQDNYSLIRDAIEAVIPGFDDFNMRMLADEGFILPHPPRDSRTFPTKNKKANFIVYPASDVMAPEGQLLLQTMRAHDQHNSQMYALGDRYRGISDGRFVLFINPEDLAELGIEDGSPVDIYSHWPGQDGRVLRGYRAVSYPTKKGCVAAYFPEANELIPRESVAEVCNTPTSKQTVVTVKPGKEFFMGSRPVAEIIPAS